ncbi:DsrE family protein [Cellulophaga sp. Z1A5H]|uniref:DsrE family protein n=1 Tax=Cellulophaga sp. Z1A5H TaxID=2687291 RepID=UPI0013FD136D|nr:DsrE family protein [Cellulophaga sp. Z1A5H]
MKSIRNSLILSIILLNLSFGQEKASGPIIKDFGEVFKVEKPDFKVATTQEFKAVFDVGNSPKEHTKINPYMETGARFLNMHAQAGVPVNQLKAALVIHGAATKDVLTDAAYKKKYGTKNPNLELIKALLAADVQVILCGQSANSWKIEKTEMINGVQLSLSAMTALVLLQNDDYRLIKF